MQNTNFTNSSGLNDPDNYSTARDILIMSNYLIKNYPDNINIFMNWNSHGTEQGVNQSSKAIETHYCTKILELME